MPWEQPGFWQNFWPSFLGDALATFLVGSVLVGLFSWVRSRATKVDVRVVAYLREVSDTGFKLDVAVRNTGRVSFRSEEIYWGVIIFDLNNPRIVPMKEDPAIDWPDPPERPYIRVGNLLRAPVFVGRDVAIFSILGNSTLPASYDLRFWLSTPHGLFPRGVKVNERGNFTSETVGRVEILDTSRPGVD